MWARVLAWQGAFERMAGHLERADQLAEQSLSVLEQVSGDTRFERAFALRVRGEAAFRPCQQKRELYQQSLALYRALDDSWSSARLLCDLGDLSHQKGQYEDAERWLEASLQLRRAVSDRAGTAETLLFLCNHAAYTGHLTQGESWAREAIHVYREMNDEAGMARTSFFLAIVLCFSGQFREALPLLEDYIRFTAWLGQRAELAWAEQNLHWIQMNLGMYEQARILLGSAMTYFQENGDTGGMAYNFLEEAYLALLAAAGTGSRADYEAAYRYAEQSLMLFRELKSVDQGLAWAELGYTAHCLGRRAEARRHIREGLCSARDARAPQTIVIVLANLAAILADDEPEQAIEVYALASRHPYVGSSRLWQDLLEPRVTAAAARLPLDVVKAAQARGQEGDLAATTEYWLRKLRMDQPGVPAPD